MPATINAIPPKISRRVALMGAKLMVEIEEIAVLAMNLVRLSGAKAPIPLRFYAAIKSRSSTVKLLHAPRWFVETRA